MEQLLQLNSSTNSSGFTFFLSNQDFQYSCLDLFFQELKLDFPVFISWILGKSRHIVALTCLLTKYKLQ